MSKASTESLIKRGTPSAWPHELTVVDDPNDQLYDERLDLLPVTDERIRNFVLVGQIQPVAVQVHGDDLAIADGRERWKIATVINHVAGVHPYEGKNKPVREALRRLKGTAMEKLIADRCAQGIKLQFVLNRSKGGALVTTSANEQRDDDPLATKMRRAQRMASQGHQPKDIADAFGKTEQTIKAWIARDLDKPREKKAKVAGRPGAHALAAMAENTVLVPREADLLKWAAGAMDTKTLIKEWPELSAALETKPNGTARQQAASVA